MVRQRIPTDFLERIAAHLTQHGFRVVDDGALAPTDYRHPATRTRSVRLQGGPRVKGELRSLSWAGELEMTHEEGGTVRYAVTLPKLMPYVPWLLLTPALILLVAAQGRKALEVMAIVVAVWGAALATQRAAFRETIERLVDEELERAPVQNDQGTSYAQTSASSAQPSASHSGTSPSLAKETPHLRIPPESPALAATVRTARDASVHRPERSPEEEVRALEETSRRRGE